MGKLALLLVFLAARVVNSLGQAPDWLWAVGAGDSGDDAGYAIAVDGNGNSFVTGSFDGPSITFGSTTLVSAGGSDMFVAKYDASGNVLWAVGAGGIWDEQANSISIDIDGNMYVAGRFQSPSFTFGATTLTCAGYHDMFIAKFDASGNALWAVGAGGSDWDEAHSICVDINGNIYVAGFFYSSSITLGSTTLNNVSYAHQDIFIAKYDGSGNALWAVGAGGGYNDVVHCISVDLSGNSYVAGSFEGSSITFGSTTLSNAGYGDLFIAKYDGSGNALWAIGAGGSGWDEAESISVANEGHIFVTGYFWGPSITLGSTTLAGYADVFLAKYDTSGNALWAASAGGTGSDFGRSISVDISGNCHVVGSFRSPVITFGSTTLTNAGLNDMFIAKYDASGNSLWAVGAGGSDNDDAHSISVDVNGSSNVTGRFSSPSIAFGATTLTKSASIFSDLFIAQLDAPAAIEETGWTTLDLFPNPATTQIEIRRPILSSWREVKIIEIHDVLGKTVRSQQPASRDPDILSVDVSDLSPGVYFLKLIGADAKRMARFVKQ